MTADELREFLNYCPDSGVFTRIKDAPKGQFKAGYPVGTDSGLYKQITLNGRKYTAHRLAWLYVHGEWPEQIDHISGDRYDNRLSNLRNVTNRENGRNQKVHSNSSTGISGVYWKKDKNKWTATIRVDYKRIFLGYSDDFFEACCLRKSAENRYGFHENHGRA